MKRITTLLTLLLTALMATSTIQAGPFLFFDQLFGSGTTAERKTMYSKEVKKNINQGHQDAAGIIVPLKMVRPQVQKNNQINKMVGGHSDDR